MCLELENNREITEAENLSDLLSNKKVSIIKHWPPLAQIFLGQTRLEQLSMMRGFFINTRFLRKCHIQI